MATRSKEDVVQEFRIHSIQDAAMRVIARKGMAAATMQEIAEEAGVAKGTIYLYFRDRDELVERTFDTAITQLIERVNAAMDSSDGIEQKIRAAMTAKFAYFRENREFFRLYMSLRVPEGSPQQQRRQKRTCQSQYRDSRQRLADVFGAAMERGEIRRLDAERLALFVVEGSNAIVIDRVMSEKPPAEESDIEFLTEVIMGGIRLQRSLN